MKKTLICVENVAKYICAQTNKVYCDKNTIITASAKDYCSAKGVEVVYDVAPYNSDCGCAKPTPQPVQAAISYEKENDALKSIISEGCKASSSSCCSRRADPFEQVLIKLAIIIQENFGVTDLVKLRAMSLEAAKIIQKNL